MKCHTKGKILVDTRFLSRDLSNLIVRVFIAHNKFWKSINFSILAHCKLWKNVITSMDYGVAPSTVLETLLHLYF